MALWFAANKKKLRVTYQRKVIRGLKFGDPRSQKMRLNYILAKSIIQSFNIRFHHLYLFPSPFFDFLTLFSYV